MTGIAAVAKAEPDGYTIGLSSAGPLAITPALSETMPYDVHKDLKLLTEVVEVPELLVVADNVPAKTFGELIALAKSKPGKLNFASTGIGGVPHMAGELLKVSAGIDVEHVPYRGAAPAVNDLLGGHVNMMFADIPVLLGNVTAGKLRALAIGSARRAPSAPDVPTTAELGMPQVLANNWYGLVAPSGIPAEIAAKIYSAAVEALNSTEVKDKLALGRDHGRQHGRTVFGACEGRDGEVGAGRQGGGRQAAVICTKPAPASLRRAIAHGE